MFCELCGTRVDDGTPFCPNCGNRLSDPAQDTPRPVAPVNQDFSRYAEIEYTTSFFSETSYEDLEKKAMDGEANAQYYLALRYIADEIYFYEKEKPSMEAMEWLRAAANQNHACAEYHIALSMMLDKNMPTGWSNAPRWLESAANQGYGPAQYAVAELYEKHPVLDPSGEKQRHWRQKIGNNSAVYRLTDLRARAIYWGDRGAASYVYNDVLNIRKRYDRMKLSRGAWDLYSEAHPEEWEVLRELDERANALRVSENLERTGTYDFLTLAGWHLLPLTLALFPFFWHTVISKGLLVCTAIYGGSFLFFGFLLFSELKKPAVGILLAAAATAVYYSKAVPIIPLLAVAVSIGICLYNVVRLRRYERANNKRKEYRNAFGDRASDYYHELREEYINRYHERPEGVHTILTVMEREPISYPKGTK